MKAVPRSFLRGALGAIALCAAAALGAPHAAEAGTLTGDTLHVYFLYPDTSSIYYDLGTHVVPHAEADVGGYTWGVTGNQVTFTAGGIGAGPFAAGAFNGLEFVDETQDPHITGITLDPGVTVPTASIPLVTFTSNQMFFNFAGDPKWFGTITFNLAFGPVATTPVPPALPLFITAMGGLGFLAWRRRRNGETSFAAA